jgi:hypothetical protein
MLNFMPQSGYRGKMLIANPRGGYSFIKGIAPYSGGGVAANGFEIVHACFRQPVPLKQGFDRVTAHLGEITRPMQALCGMELRSPRPFSFQGFNDFNAGYVGVLKSWDVFLDGVNPIARTNVAPEIGAPTEPSLYGFSYTVPSQSTGAKTFVVAGGGELPEGSLDPHDVVRRGETSNDALREKTKFVMGLMTGRVKELGVTWDLATVTEIYTVHSICSFLADEIVKPMAGGALHGMLWHYSRPPIVSIEYEMDLRGVRRELVLEV